MLLDHCWPVSNPHLYWYKARIRSVYDGDSVRADIKLGLFAELTEQAIRLYALDAPEVRGAERPQGLIVRDYLRELIDGKDVVIRTYLDRKGKWGRLLGVIYLETDDGWMCVNQHLLDKTDLGVVANTYGDDFDGFPAL